MQRKKRKHFSIWKQVIIRDFRLEERDVLTWAREEDFRTAGYALKKYCLSTTTNRIRWTSSEEVIGE